MKTDDFLEDVVMGLTLSETENKSLKKQWLQLKVLSQLTEKELFTKNLENIQSIIDNYNNLDTRVKQLEMYLGALKNQFEEYRRNNDKSTD
jgi:uncharacterized protein YdcH (DUF465 family)